MAPSCRCFDIGLIGKLNPVQIRIGTFQFKQLIMTTHLDYPAVLHHDNPIGALDRGESMGDDNSGTIFHEIF